jgi:hypothetical protein
MRVIIDSHPRLCCGPESEAFLREALDIDKLAEKFKLEPCAIDQAYHGSDSRAEFVDRLAALCCAATGKPRWAEKTPRNVLNLQFIFEKFPRAKFIHMLRDGRDVACSLRTHPKYRVVDGKLVPTNKRKPIKKCAERWRDSLLAARPFMSDPRFRTVRYEELVADPRKTIAGIVEFIGEPWDDALLSHSEAASIFRDATTFPQTPEANRPIENVALARWKRDMSQDDKRIFKDVAGDLLIEFGYVTDCDW